MAEKSSKDPGKEEPEKEEGSLRGVTLEKMAREELTLLEVLEWSTEMKTE